MSTLRAGWEQFDRTVILPEIPDTIREQIRRAFYAGAGVALANVELYGLGEPRRSLAQLLGELVQFRNGLRS